MAKSPPPFINNPHFVMEVDNWHMTSDASEEEKRQFDEWMSQKDIVFNESNAYE